MSSPRSRSRFFGPTLKQPPPEHGVRLQRAGTTWWGKRWLEALERVLRGDAGRLSRGRTYARAGRTHDLSVEGGKVSARVTGSRVTPYEVSLALTTLDDATWRTAIGAMARKAQFSAELLAGRMPPQIDEAFAAAGASLFPRTSGELATHCSCPDTAAPCKHVAATHYLLGEALDRDPFLLFELRGRTKAQVLDALRRARASASASASGPDASLAGEPLGASDVPRVSLGTLRAEDYERPATALPALRFSFRPPQGDGAVLRQLGAPPGWQAASSPADTFGPVVRAAADAARRLALADPALAGATGEPEPPAAPDAGEPPRRRAKRRSR